jgi:hypothetical protein
VAISFLCCGARIGVETIENFARVAGALSLLASFRMGHGGEWRRAREKPEPPASTGLREPRCTNDETSSPGCGREARRKSPLVWVSRALTVLWIGALLFIVGYATFKGELALADLEQLDLVATYSMTP